MQSFKAILEIIIGFCGIFLLPDIYLTDRFLEFFAGVLFSATAFHGFRFFLYTRGLNE